MNFDGVNCVKLKFYQNWSAERNSGKQVEKETFPDCGLKNIVDWNLKFNFLCVRDILKMVS